MSDKDQEKEDSACGGANGDKKPSLLEQTTSRISISDFLRDLNKLKVTDQPKPESLLDEVTFEGVAKYIKSGRCQKIVTLAGAGISTSAGIPDFRSPGTGLYDNLDKYDLPRPEAVFDIGYFKENPEPFFLVSKELYPGNVKPTPCHYFLQLLNNKKKLLRHFTQNVDALERLAGLSDDKIVEAHGTYNTSHCLECGQEYTQTWMKGKLFNDSEDVVIPKCEQDGCDGVVKPDIVFFGESLPKKFADHMSDLQDCDMLIILGTSLAVQPFSMLPGRVKDDVPRLYINLEKCNISDNPFMMMLMGTSTKFAFDDEDNIRDVFWQGTCDDGCYALADALGWGDELRSTVKKEHARFEKQFKDEDKKKRGSKEVKGTKKKV